MNTIRFLFVQNIHVLVAALLLCHAVAAFGEDFVDDPFMEVNDNVAFPDVELLPQNSSPLLTRKGAWVFSVSVESDRQVLRAESGENVVTQSITTNAVHKRFVFDLKRQRFEPMRQEIRIDQGDESVLQRIEKLSGVSGVKHYKNLGFSIVKIDVAVNPVAVLRTLRNQFEKVEARILTGFFDDEPM